MRRSHQLENIGDDVMKSIASIVACLFLLSVSAFALADGSRFDIPAQSLPEALKAFADQAKMQLLYQPAAVGAGTSNAVVGELDKRAALELLLRGTGFEVVFSKGNAATVRAVERAPKTSSTEARGVAPLLRLVQSEAGGSQGMQANPEFQSSSAESAKSTEQSAATLEEIIVTAQRREQNLQDVPISMSVLGGEQLDAATTGVMDQLRTVPGVANLSVEGGSDGTILSVRGVTTSAPGFGGTSVVGYYLDSVPFGFIRQSFLPDANAYDLDRVEVLRGPQGTLYGVNSVNGVVRVLTHTPDLDKFAAKVRASTSVVEDGEQGYRADGAVNIPIVPGKFAARAVVGYEDSPGWVDAPYGRDINDRQSTSARLRLAAAPTDNLSLGFMIWHSDATADAYDKSLPDRTIGSTAQDEIDSDYDIYAFDARYEFSQFALSSATSYMDYGSDVIVRPQGNTGNILDSFFDSKVFSQEFSVDSTGEGPWQWSLGTIYRDVEDHVQQNLRALPAGVGNFANPNGFGYTDISRSYAIFGEVTRSFNDGTFDITAGLRYFKDEQKLEETDNLTLPNAPLAHAEQEFDSVTPRLVLNWRPTDALTIYTSYAQGFRSGLAQSPNVVVATAGALGPIEPDTLTSYEVGAKGDAFDSLLSFDSALYFINWQDVQTPLRVPIPGTTSFLGALANADEATGIGMEAAVTLRPTEGLSLTLNGGWNDLAFTSDLVTRAGSAGVPVVLVREGGRLPLSPEWTANFMADYRFPLGAFDANVSAGVSYVSELAYYALSGTTATAAYSDESTISRVGFGVEAPKGWGVALSVENLTDKNGIVDPIQFGAARLRPQPRTFVLQLNYDF